MKYSYEQAVDIDLVVPFLLWHLLCFACLQLCWRIEVVLLGGGTGLAFAIWIVSYILHCCVRQIPYFIILWVYLLGNFIESYS